MGGKQIMGASKRTYEKVLSLLGDINGKLILDCGAGKGKFSETLKNKGAIVEACDIDKKQFLSKSIKFTEADLNKKLPYEDSRFDIIISIEVLEHLENPSHFLTEIKRILKKGGKAIITTPNISNIKSRLQFLFKGNLHWFNEAEFGYSGSNHINPIYYKEILFILKKNNLELVELATNRNRNYTFYVSNTDTILKKTICFIANLLCDTFYRILSFFLYSEEKKLKTADILIFGIRKR
jgi:2-polyprenyl-3-methyl-5-hydroxy-6-metoxy-1,4-benzoquinol methylase